MRKLGMVVVLAGTLAFWTAAAQAQQLNVSVQKKTMDGSDGPNAINVEPGEVVEYQVKGVLTSSPSHLGLALVGFNLVYSGGDLLQANTPTGACDNTCDCVNTCDNAMAHFVKNCGITNPAGYGGTIINGDLVQVGGGQNSIKNQTSADFPKGLVKTGVAQVGGCGPAILATGQLTIPSTAGAGESYTLSLTELFANVFSPGQNGTEEFWATQAASAGTNSPLTMTVASTALPQLTASFPAANGNLWRSTSHIMRLRFNADLGGAPTAGEVTIRKLLAGGTFGPDLSNQFDFAIENDPDGFPRVLRITDTGNNLEDRAWYAVANGGTWPGAEDFRVDLRQAVGNVNNDNFVNALDLSDINSRVSPLQRGNTFSWTDAQLQSDYRRNVNADNFINANDLSTANSKVSPLALPAKPSGH
jgi:hypothetical protein